MAFASAVACDGEGIRVGNVVFLQGGGSVVGGFFFFLA